MNRVSVIIPTYNRKDLLREAINSVINQTFTDWELIVIDNGSTDGTNDMVQSAYKGRIRCHTIPHSALPADSRNAGIRIARGPYIAFLDSDDLWMPEKLERQIHVLDQDKAAGWSYSNALSFGSSHSARKLLYAPWRIRSGRIFEHLLCGNCAPTSSVVVRKSCLETVGLFEPIPELLTAEDYELWLRLAWHFPVRAINTPLVLYRVYDHNLSHVNGFNAAPAFVALEQAAAKLFLSVEVYRKAKAALALASSRKAVCEDPAAALRWLSDACRLDPYNMRARWYQALWKMGGGHSLAYWLNLEQRVKQLVS